jgi:transforming growth factor-beta-induced protein
MKVLSALLPLLISSFASGQTIVDVAVSDATLSTLVTAITAAGLGDVLTTGNFTVFAPTDDAFAALDQALLTKLLEPAWIAHLQAVLLNHVLASTLVFAADLVDGTDVPSLLSSSYGGFDPWMFTVDDTGVFISGEAFEMAQVIQADIVASNGVIHKVDKVLVPAILVSPLLDVMVEIGEFTGLVGFIESTGLAPVVETETMTLFAPIDEIVLAVPAGALDAYNLTEILLNHVVLGDPLPSPILTDGYTFTTALGNTYTVTIVNGAAMIGEIPVVGVDFVGANGVVHAIGGVLLPPLTSSNTTTPPGMVSSDPPMATEPPMGTEPPMDSPMPGSTASSSNRFVSAVLVLLASSSAMLL